MNSAYKVRLEKFEGPLDLLLHLIHQYEINIYDIPVAEISEQYMEYVHAMKYLELNVASEYLVMAATLVAIKSQMLLPKQESPTGIDEYEEDPREELIERLLEYQKYKQAAEHLKKKGDSSQVFTRPPVSIDLSNTKRETIENEMSIYDMLGALNKMFQRKQWNEPLESRVTRTEIPIEQRMQEVLDAVKYKKEGVSFDELFAYKTRSHIVITFMALLELMKNNEVFCRQKNHLEVLYIFHRQN